ncbi:MAG: NYN domain-containing protein [Planctomycetaceae bacterium]
MQLLRAYVFVDAENHFIRSNAAAQDIVGSARAAEAIAIGARTSSGIIGFPNAIEGKRFGWNPEIQLFWDCYLLSRGGTLAPLNAHVQRAIYACSCTGDEDKAHSMRVLLRKYEFEPLVIRELKNQQKQRDTKRQQHGLIEKPKGCDIALATRMVADGAADLFDCCFLFTSDADFLPAVEAVRRMGKIVWVFGYADALPERSPYLFTPDRFVDLGHKLKTDWHNNKTEINKALASLGETGDISPTVA